MNSTPINVLVGDKPSDFAARLLRDDGPGVAVDASAPQTIEHFWKQSRSSVWVATNAADLDCTIQLPQVRGPGIVVMEPIDDDLETILKAQFARVISPNPLRLLPPDELADVLLSRDRADLFIAVLVNRSRHVMVLYRGDLTSLVVRLGDLRVMPDGTKPDFDDYEVTDFGNTVRLGAYEASADGLLYAFDPAYRRAAKARQRESDPSFGAALRRLRLLRGLTQDEVPGVTRREILRIESGDVQPREATMRHLAAALGVQPEEIATY